MRAVRLPGSNVWVVPHEVVMLRQFADQEDSRRIELGFRNGRCESFVYWELSSAPSAEEWAKAIWPEDPEGKGPYR